MLIRKLSRISNRWNAMDIPITHAQYEAWRNGPQLIQDAFPHLTPSQREFLLSGSTDAEWNAAFADESTVDMSVAIEVALAKTKGLKS
jgi:hypothetical protein